jgi:hypothetical protein
MPRGPDQDALSAALAAQGSRRPALGKDAGALVDEACERQVRRDISS